MKFPGIFFGPCCCLLLAIDCLSSNEDDNGVRWSILDGHSAGYTSFIENRHHYLRMQQILHSDFVYDSMKCALNCLVTVGCRSFNFRLQQDLDGKHFCEMLASDMFNQSRGFELSAEYHHDSILVRVAFYFCCFLINSFLPFIRRICSLLCS